MNIKQILGAALLAVAVVGGTATYLSASLHPASAQVALDGVTTEQSQMERHAEVIVTEGRAS